MGNCSAVVKVPTGRELARVVAEGLGRHLRDKFPTTYHRIAEGTWEVNEQAPRDGDLFLLLERGFNLNTEAEGLHEEQSFSFKQFKGLWEAWGYWCKTPVWVQAQLLLGIWEWQWEGGGTAVADRFLIALDAHDLWDAFPVFKQHYIDED